MSARREKQARRAAREARGISRAAAQAEREFAHAAARLRVRLNARPIVRRDGRRRVLAAVALIAVALLSLWWVLVALGGR